MLERIIISKVRTKILKIFLLNPKDSYHIRALVRILGEEINAVRRELKNLELFGLIKSQKQTNKIVYSIDPTCIFLKELRSIFLKDTNEINLISKVLGKIEKIENVIITRSYIHKEYFNDSDVDILIIGSPSIGKLNQEMNKVEKEIGRELRMVVISKEDFEFKKKRREQFIVNILENENIELLGYEN